MVYLNRGVQDIQTQLIFEFHKGYDIEHRFGCNLCTKRQWYQWQRCVRRWRLFRRWFRRRWRRKLVVAT
jgi:hypothetical protein